MNRNDIRALVLTVVNEMHDEHGNMQVQGFLNRIQEKLRTEKPGGEFLPVDHFSHADEGLHEVVLTAFYDLFRNGYLAWGMDFHNASPPWFHLTGKGRKALENISRDPYNVDGYMAYLASAAPINPVAQSYILEALNTFNNNCFKSSAVMVGTAAESLILELRDTLVSKMQTLKKAPAKNMLDWRFKTVLDAFESEIQEKLPRPLRESFDGHWLAFTTQIRMTRNDAGHPKSVDPVKEEEVYATLLMFPQLAVLSEQLKSWITSSYS